jgi:hypothetical protein
MDTFVFAVVKREGLERKTQNEFERAEKTKSESASTV